MEYDNLWNSLTVLLSQQKESLEINTNRNNKLFFKARKIVYIFIFSGVWTRSNGFH